MPQEAQGSGTCESEQTASKVSTLESLRARRDRARESYEKLQGVINLMEGNEVARDAIEAFAKARHY
jgi:hypothetical protein